LKEETMMILYKDKTKRWHDKRVKIKEFNPSDKVLLFNSRVKLLRHEKLRSKWDGLFSIIESSAHGATALQNEGKYLKVNGC